MRRHPYFPLLPGALVLAPYRNRPEVLRALPSGLTFESACQEVSALEGVPQSTIRDQALGKIVTALEPLDMLNSMRALSPICVVLLAWVFTQAVGACSPGTPPGLRAAKRWHIDLRDWLENGRYSDTVRTYLFASNESRARQINKHLCTVEKSNGVHAFPWRAWRQTTIFAMPSIRKDIYEMRGLRGDDLRCWYGYCPGAHPQVNEKAETTCPTCRDALGLPAL